jgi:colanic acid/amylovoran biosynthesis glycosyltransferase
MKLIIHAINGVGLGHLNRTILIADLIKKKHKEIEIKFITNSKFPELISKSGYEYIQLNQNTDEVIRNKLNYNDYLLKNYIDIKKYLDKEKANSIIIDSEYNDKLVEYCFKKKIRVIYILREKPYHLLVQLFNQKYFKNINAVIIPHLKNELPIKKINLLKEYTNIFFLGPITKTPIKNSKFKQKEKITEINILILFSSGANIDINKPIYEKVQLFLKNLNENNDYINNIKINIKIITGPFFNIEKYDFYEYAKVKFEFDINKNYKWSDIIISPAGYNIINEIVINKIPALIVPLKRNEDNQFSRARKLEELGCIKIVNKCLFKELNELIVKDLIKDMKLKFPIIKSNNEVWGNFLVNKIRSNPNKRKKKIAYFRNPFLDITDNFIFDQINNISNFNKIGFTLENRLKYDILKVFSSDIFNKLYSPKYPFILKKNIDLYDYYINYCIKYINEEKVDILHAEFGTDALFYLMIKKRIKLPFIVSFRGSDIYHFGNLNKNVYTVLFDSANIFLVRSKLMKKELINLGCPKDKIIVHHSSIDFRKIKLIDSEKKLRNIKKREDSINLLFVGRLIEKKGIIDLLYAFKIIIKKKKNIKLSIVGNGQLNEDINSIIKENNLEKNINKIDFLSNEELLKIIKKQDLVIQPSKTAKNGDKEGIPVVLMESMALKVPVISTYHSAIGELIKDNYSGFLVTENCPEELAKKIEFVIDEYLSQSPKSEKKLNKILNNAYKKVYKEYNLKFQIKKLEDIYEQISQEIEVEYTLKCNLNCEMCYQKSYRLNNKKEELRNSDLQNFIGPIYPKNIMLSGGEPFFKEGIMQLLSFLQTNKIDTKILTNGTLLSNNEINKLINLNYVNTFGFSIDSFNIEEHNHIRNDNFAFEKTLDTVYQLMNKKRIGISSVFLGENKEGIKKVIDFCKRYNIFLTLLIDEIYTKEEIENTIKILYLRFNKKIPLFIKKSVNINNLKIKRDFLELINYAESKKLNFSYPYLLNNSKFNKRDIVCSTFYNEKMRINSNGDIIGCRLLREKFGNIKFNKKEEIINNSKYIEFKRKMLKEELLPICYKCPKQIIKY